MAKMIPAAERISRAQALIQKARDVPIPAETGRYDISYVASVKDLLRQARDLIKFISYSPSASKEMKAEVTRLFEEADRVEKEIFHK
jgi:hypothetical protein